MKLTTRRTVAVIVLISAVIAALACWIIKHRLASQPFLDENGFFVPVQADLSKNIDAPTVTITLENQNFSLLLDTGYAGHLSLSAENINKIQNKNFQRIGKHYGFFGKVYEANEFTIEEIKIAAVTFHNLTLDEESEEFVKDSTIIFDESDKMILSGKLGWRLFEQSNLLLDFRNSKIGFTNRVSMLVKEGYPIFSFTKVPIHLDRGFVEIDLESSVGCLRCILDTGSSANLFNADLNVPVEEMIQKTGYVNCRLKSKDIGSIRFHPFPMKLPFHVDGVLGMEFFMNHCVFLDFRNEVAYIKKYEQACPGFFRDHKQQEKAIGYTEIKSK